MAHAEVSKTRHQLWMEDTVKTMDGQRHLTRQELAQRLGVPAQTLAGWKVKGYGPRSFRVGRYVRYRIEDVEEWEQEQVDAEATA